MMSNEFKYQNHDKYCKSCLKTFTTIREYHNKTKSHIRKHAVMLHITYDDPNEMKRICYEEKMKTRHRGNYVKTDYWFSHVCLKHLPILNKEGHLDSKRHMNNHCLSYLHLERSFKGLLLTQRFLVRASMR